MKEVAATITKREGKKKWRYKENIDKIHNKTGLDWTWPSSAGWLTLSQLYDWEISNPAPELAFNMRRSKDKP